MNLYWSADAMRQRDEIFDYIALDNPIAALKLDNLFESKALQLLNHPQLGRSGRVPGTRELVIPPAYLLIYNIDGDAVRILRVLHGAQQWPAQET